jgi:hypothetical protein
MNKKLALVVVIAVGVLLLGYMFYSSTSNVRYRVEVCMAFQGRTSCRTARADNQEHALRSAQSNACALIASGVTDTMQCEHAGPTSVKWLELGK